jgi:hypothetical protein
MVLATAPASANTGIPMLMVAWPLLWVLFPVVVLVEAAVGVRVMRIPFRQALNVSARANVWSTAAAIPTAWGKALLFQFLASLLFLLVYAAVTYFGGLRRPVSEEWPGPRNFPLEAVSLLVFCAWIMPRSYEPSWELAVALIGLCVPFYFTSVRFETDVALRHFPEDRAADVRRWMSQAHKVSYGLIACMLSAIAINGIWRTFPGPTP